MLIGGIFMETGYVRVDVSFARDGAPGVAALVTASFLDGTEFQSRVTDVSGKTTNFEFPAPDAELSLDPNYEGEVYSQVRVAVEMEAYKLAIVTGIQVFAGVTAVVPINLEPRTVGGDATTSDLISDYFIPDHKVSDNLPNDADKPPENARILGFVSIPNYVTVHLGTPSSSAQNVTVGFIDYIKNVCCSEIYPTWPDNSIRANVYCQISLVLNRIFTEWYKSKGYSFDITNSTSYDQFFVYGRNIYENVSKIVDGIFNVYMRKGNNLDPYYSEYCNGTTATCPGLSQWGTVSLANQGYSPLSILRYYYGNTINLYDAPIGNASIESYPGTPLRLGSRGSDVTVIQEQLLRIRQNYPLIPSVGSADGIFGQATEAAVIQFQRIFNLTADGIVGKSTWYKISYIFVAVKKLAELGSEGITNPAIVSPIPSEVLRRGSTGENVSLAQYLLTSAADFYESVNPINVDGIFGPNTESATKAFQTSQSLTADGIIGPLTWSKLYRIYYSINNSITSVGSTAYPGTSLSVGSVGSNVALIQRYLNYIATYFPSINQLTIDSRFGNATAASVIRFQQLFGLTADGIVGRNTWNAIISVYNSVIVYI